MSIRSCLRRIAATIAVLIVSAWSAGYAYAADCIASNAQWCDCTTTGIQAYCGGGSTLGGGYGAQRVCSVTNKPIGGGIPPYTFKCDLDINYSGAGASVVVVLNSVDEIEASGYDPAGNEFCCKYVADRWGAATGYSPYTVDVDVDGTTYADLIEYTYVDAFAVTHNLETPPAAVGWMSVHGYVHAGEGDDEVWGSNMGGNNYHEWLYGEDDVDTTHGGAYWDHIFGGSGGDFLYGEGAIDTINGGTGDDYIEGGDESCGGGACMGDDIDGGNGADTILGGTAEDTIQGGGGNDCIDGEEDADTINGGIDDDIITGGSGEDWVYGDAGADTFYMNDNEQDNAVEGGTQVDEHEAPGVAPDPDASDPFNSTTASASLAVCE